MKEIYLDNSATTRVFPEVAELMSRIYLEDYGNPSSMHHKGVEAEKYIRSARQTLAGILRVQPGNLVFTSCGTEGDNMAIIGCALAGRRSGRHLVTTSIEHPAVLESMKYLESQGFEVTILPVDRQGLVDPADVAAAVREDTVLVSVMHTNNEIGTVQPLEEIGAAIRMAILLLTMAGRMESAPRIEVSCDDRGTAYAVYAADGELEDSGTDWAPLVKRLKAVLGDDSKPVSVIWP